MEIVDLRIDGLKLESHLQTMLPHDLGEIGFRIENERILELRIAALPAELRKPAGEVQRI